MIMSNIADNRIQKIVGQPLYWCWLFVAIWVVHVLVAMLAERWTGVAISLFGLLGALLVVSAIQSRRRKNLYPDLKKNLARRQA